MSPSGRAEGVARLRRVIAEIESEAGRPSGRAARRLPLARSFDSALGGGLADDALHEIAPARPADGAAAMGFALALAARFLSRRRPASALLISEGFADQESGALYGPGLVAHGAPLSRLVFVRAPDAALAFWAMEEALKCGAPAVVVGEIWNLKTYSLAASRRLLLAARKGKVPALLILASAYGQAERLSSAAETRLEIAAQPSAKTPAAAGPDLPGPFACGARLIKARLSLGAVDSPSKDGRPSERPMDRVGRDQRSRLQAVDSPSKDGRPSGCPTDRAQRARLQAFDAERVIRLEWRSQDLTFKDMSVDDPAISLPLAAASGDRPRAAARPR
jgi:protein ImuA